MVKSLRMSPEAAKNVLASPSSRSSPQTNSVPATCQQQQQPVRQQPTSPGVAAPQMGWQQPLPQQQPMRQPMQQPMMLNTGHEHPTNDSFRHSLSRCGLSHPNWRFCPICGNMNMSASLVLICHEFTAGQTRIIQPDTRFCEDARNVYSCIRRSTKAVLSPIEK